MMKYLSELKKFLVEFKKKTDDLERLEAKVDELIVEEIMKDCLSYRHSIETVTNGNEKWIRYNVKEDDYLHIFEYLWLIQMCMPKDVFVCVNSLLPIYSEKEKNQYTVTFMMKGKK